MTNSIVEFLRAVKTPMGKLVRIEGLVVITAAILLLISVLDSFRRRSRSSVLKLLLLILDTVSASTVTYTTGLIQNVSFKNELLQVWVVLLTTLKESNDYISSYGAEQTQDRRRRELRDLMESFWVAYLNATRGSDFIYPLWILWGLNFCKILHRIVMYERAAHSYSFGKNPMLTSNYMRYEHELSELSDVDPAQMRGYKYLVMGEDEQKIETTAPGYLMRLNVTRENKFITLDKIRQCDGWLLSSRGGDADGKLKDVCLSFAMYKLLRRRFDKSHALRESDHWKHRDLVFRGLLSEDSGVERLFRVIEIELAFLTDYFYSRYPIVFSNGFPIFSIVRVVMVGAISWLTAAVLLNFKWKEGDVRHFEHGVDVGKAITLVLLFVLIVKEVWEIVTYVFSDWAKVVLICKYVEKPSWRKFAVVERLLCILCRCCVTRPWHGRVGQYSLLSTFSYEPWNLGHKLTCGLVVEKKRGERKQASIKLPNEVKRAIFDSLRSNGDRLTRGRCSLERNNLLSELSWTLKFKTNTETILAWHVATSVCEIEMRARYKNKLIDKFRSMCRPSPFFVDLKNLKGKLRCHYEVAASLSRYCAYLILSKQQMLSDPPAAEFILEHTVLKARDVLKDCDSIESMYRKLMKAEELFDKYRKLMKVEELFDKYRKLMKVEEPFDKGAKLGKFLIEKVVGDEFRWKVLAEVWAELLLFVAPTSHSSAHESALAKGGEFVTNLWALLSHAGILEQPEASEPI